MLDTPYDFYLVGADGACTEPIRKVYYHFNAKKRRYFVTFEFFSFNIIAVKYRDNDHKGSPRAYSKLLKDHDAFRVIGTCFHIMAEVWKNYPQYSFAFYATPRSDEDVKKKNLDEQGQYSYRRSRYNIYRYGTVNYFRPEDFTHVRDDDNSILYPVKQEAR